MDALKRAMAWDEEDFGREYDLDVFNIVAVSDFNMGAMENKGLNIFNDKYVLADQETATDTDYANIEAIIAHEYFHNWTGNRITCRDWFQLCLKEGLTVFRDHEFSADQRSRAVQAHRRGAHAARASVSRGPGPARASGAAAPLPRDQQFLHRDGLRKGRGSGAHDPHPPRRRDVPRKAWTSISSAMTARPPRSRISCSVFEDVSGRDLAQFALWYHQAGTPNLTVTARATTRGRVSSGSRSSSRCRRPPPKAASG